MRQHISLTAKLQAVLLHSQQYDHSFETHQKDTRVYAGNNPRAASEYRGSRYNA